MSSPLVQYIVLRRDLTWPRGAIVAQGCHASTAALHLFRDLSETKSYLNDLARMHKIVLGIDGEQALQTLAQNLTEANVSHHMWIEQPENVCTALATAPCYKSTVQAFFKGLKLLNWFTVPSPRCFFDRK